MRISNAQIKKEIVEAVKGLVEYEALYFGSPLQLKLSPHSWPILIHAVQVSPADGIYLMDGGEQWHPLERHDLNYDKVLQSLYQRVKAIEKQCLTNSRA